MGAAICGPPSATASRVRMLSAMTLASRISPSRAARTLASYDRFSNRLANVRAARDGEIRDARVIADSIRTRLAVALGGPQIAAPIAPPPPVR